MTVPGGLIPRDPNAEVRTRQTLDALINVLNGLIRSGDVIQESGGWRVRGDLQSPSPAVPFLAEDSSTEELIIPGPPGVQGIPGLQGIPSFLLDDPSSPEDGSPGQKGDTGQTGPAGADGATGLQGLVGPATYLIEEGIPGEDGIPGPAGSVGPIGPTGDTGSTGPAGDTGATGSQGPMGPAVFLLEDGPEGDAGSVGPAGPQGLQGSAVFLLEDGPEGEMGLTGLKGATGATGTAGTTGSQGPVGPAILFLDDYSQEDSIIGAGVAAAATGGSGTVTSVGLSLPIELFVVSGSPVTGAGTLSATFQSMEPNLVFASPMSGTNIPTFRTLINTDLPLAAIAANKAAQEGAAITLAFVAPATQQYHPSASKAWVKFDASSGTPTILASYNVSSLTDNGVGDTTINFTTAFSSADYSWAYGGSTLTNDSRFGWNQLTAPATGSFRLGTSGSSQANSDGKRASIVFFGDQ